MSSFDASQPLAPQPIPALELPSSVHAGLPSPADELGARRIDLAARLIEHPQATFLMRARGDSMTDVGIFDGDVRLVDRAVTPRSGHVFVAVVDVEFVCKTLSIRAGRVKLRVANPGYTRDPPFCQACRGQDAGGHQGEPETSVRHQKERSPVEICPSGRTFLRSPS